MSIDDENDITINNYFHNHNDELDPISFWVLLLLSGGQRFTINDLVKTINQPIESIWEALNILQQRKFARNENSMFMIDFEGVLYLTHLGILASEADDAPKPRNFKNKFKLPFFSSWADLLTWLAVLLILLIPAIILTSYIISGYVHISLDKKIYQYGIWLAYFGFVALFLKFSFHYVRETERLVIFRNGKAIGKKGPGLFFTLPLIDNPTIADMREKSLEIKKEPCLTSDNILVNAGFYMTWQVDDPIDSLTKVSKIEDSMSLLCASALRTSIAQFTMEAALARQPALNTQIRARIEHKAGDWGVQVNSTELRELQPPDRVMKHIENRFNAELDGEATIAKSNAKINSLRNFLTIGEGMARNPISEKLAYLDSIEKVNELIANEKTHNSYEKNSSSLISAKQVLRENPDFDLLHLEVMAPSFMTISDFLAKKVVVLKSIDLIYSIFALLHLGTQETKSNFIQYIQNDKQRRELIEFDNRSIYSFLYLNQIDALVVVSSAYGSPLAEDLLGIGSALGHVKELIKDISYRSKFEKEQSKISLEKLQVEKMQSEATLTRMHIENKQALLEIEKVELENKQKKIEIVEKQLTLYEKIKKQNISRKERDLITSALLIPVVQIAESEINPISLSLELDHKKLLTEQYDTEGEKKQLLDEKKGKEE